nr:hypothetical protein [uncultured Duganella sp.]
MATTARFVKAADNTRPYKSHRYDVFGPKIQRMLTLFTRAQVDAWLLLESDPLVLSYCERPMVVPDVKPKLLVDFWVGYVKREELWLAHRGTEGVSDLQASLPAFAAWAKCNRFTLRQFPSIDQAPSKVYLENWGVVVRELSANRRYVKSKLLKAVQEVLEMPRPIAAICNLLPEEDPVLVRVAAYSLLHTGSALCPDISEMPLGPASLVEMR